MAETDVTAPLAVPEFRRAFFEQLEKQKNAPPNEEVDQTEEQEEERVAESTVVPKDVFTKHPLQFTWTLWYCKNERGKNWEECLKDVTKFSTVEDFWALYNHIQLASGLSFGSDYYVFKEGVQPMWEDQANREGGRWLLQEGVQPMWEDQANREGGRWLLQVDKFSRNERMDHYWLDLLMSIVGEQYEDHSDQICGAVVNVRQKGDKISLWTANAADETSVPRIGTIMKQKLALEKDCLVYEAHQDTSHKTSSTVKYLHKI